MPEPRLILASRSPQRRAILEQVGIPFSAVIPDVVELTTGDPEAVAADNARRKAEAVAAGGVPPGAEPALILGVDTVVWDGERIYGKPPDAREARATLEALSGRRHTVISGVCLHRGEWVRTAIAHTHVHFRPLEPALLNWYLQSGEWRERAGGYAIQGRGAALVVGIEGDYLNVVGLPLLTLLELAPGLLGLPAVAKP